MSEVFLWLVQGSSCWKPTQSHRTPRLFQWGGTPSRTGLQREYTNYENGVLARFFSCWWYIDNSVYQWRKCNRLTLIGNFFFFFNFFFGDIFVISYEESCCNPQIFYNKGPMMLYLVPMYRSWSLLSISTKISTINFCVMSLWCHMHQNSKKKKKQNLFLTIKILGISNFHWVCGKSFLEWIVKQEKRSLGGGYSMGWTPHPFLNKYLILGEGGNFFPWLQWAWLKSVVFEVKNL